jgi:radical SAM protein with 4Fe4S-binding SPASM domain
MLLNKGISSEQQLYSPPNSILKKINQYYLVLDPNRPNLSVIDEIQKEIFSLCDGQHTMRQVINIISASQHLSEETTRSYVQNLVSEGFVATEPFLSTQIQQRVSNKLVTLLLHLTRECNLRCRHCVYEAGISLENELLPMQFLDVVREFASLGGRLLVLTGGEPLLRRDLMRSIIIEAKQSKIDYIYLNTNGTQWTKDDISFIKQYGVYVCVSLDGATQEKNDYIRGVGTYDKAITTIKNLVNNGVPTSIGMVLMRPNLNEIEQMVHLSKSLGVLLDVYHLILKGRAKKNEKELGYSIEELTQVVRTLLRISREAGVIANMEGLHTSMNIETLRRKKDLCGAGTRMLTVTPDGDVYPCNTFVEESMKAGNVKDETLKEIWQNSPVLREFQKLSVNSIEGCKNCELKFICGGGCPADIYHSYGNFNHCTPLCSLYKDFYWGQIYELFEEIMKKKDVQ